jgi:uncharacterized protein YceK
MRTHAAKGLAAALAIALGGCGTLYNFHPPEKADKEGPAPVPRTAYGGVATDAEVGTKWLAAPFVTERLPQVSAVEWGVESVCKVGIGAYVLAVDLPLSALADTLTLPVTVPATLKSQAAKERRAGADRQKGADEGYDVDAPDAPQGR